MRIYVDFLGDARLATSVKQTELAVSSDTSFRGLVRILSAKYPQLVGAVIEADCETLMPANIINVNGRRTIRRTEMDDGPSDGDRITFMSILAGG